MRSRGSIARLMLAIGLSALALTLLRGWLGPKNQFGFLGLMALMVLATLIAGLLTSGPIRRFFVGASSTGLIVWVAVAIAPSTILHFWMDWLIMPVDRWTHPPRGPGSFDWSDLSELELMEFSLRLLDGRGEDDIGGSGLGGWIRRRTGTSMGMGIPKYQAILLIPPALLSAFVGVVTAIYRPRPISPKSPAGRP